MQKASVKQEVVNLFDDEVLNLYDSDSSIEMIEVEKILPQKRMKNPAPLFKSAQTQK